MKTLGLLGGMSWESTAVYYRLLNEGTRDRLGGLHSAPLVIASVDFAPVAALQQAGDWDTLGERLHAAAAGLEAAGAEAIVLATNTMHKVAERITAGLAIPLLHIADATADAVKRAGVARPALLATRYTMEQDFYRGRLTDRHGLDVRVPDAPGRDRVHAIIYDELCRGHVRAESRAVYQAEIARLKADGADGVILGCTEIGLLIGAGDTDLPVFDTTPLHVAAALDFALAGEA